MRVDPDGLREHLSRRPRPLLQKGNIEIAQGAGARAGRDRSAFEKILQIVIMVVIRISHIMPIILLKP
jgi:hypothetical protein